ncbi:hypothetical protein R1sor_018310 [Riccia sorocarpa]|uniref:Uncharacterized protein n=1 Tax=Riccia sorocarpa TaxID=122646 RepID=A0ABD3I9B9_9MARC
MKAQEETRKRGPAGRERFKRAYEQLQGFLSIWRNDWSFGSFNDRNMETELLRSPSPDRQRLKFPGAVKKKAYSFDGRGKFSSIDWDLDWAQESEGYFSWFHVELPRSNQRLTLVAQYLIDILCPPLKLQEILALNSQA